MDNKIKFPKTIEELETEIVSLKIRLARIEDFIRAMPNAEEILGKEEKREDADDDELLDQAVEVVMQYDLASSSLLQRRLSIGYARAARLMDQLEMKGFVSASDGTSKPREVLINISKLKEKGKELN